MLKKKLTIIVEISEGLQNLNKVHSTHVVCIYALYHLKAQIIAVFTVTLNVEIFI